MKKSAVVLALLALIAIVPAVAQIKSEGSRTEQDFKAMTDALKLREAAAQAVANGDEKPETVLARLKAHPSPSGLNLDRDADFAFAAIDIGQRLIPKGKYAEAESLFQAAEKSLALAVARIPDSAARNKAMFLQKLALVRSQYLHDPVRAKANIEAAIKLQPDDKYFQSYRDQLARDSNRNSAIKVSKN